MFSKLKSNNFNDSWLHSARKMSVKLIVVMIWFPAQSSDLPTLFVTMSICVSFQLLTPVPPYYTV